jgi:histidinol-phosphate aminotransferase
MWKGKLQDQYLSTGQEGYATAEQISYPEGIELIDCGLGTNPLGTPPCVKEFLERTEDLSICGYPEPEPESLKRAIASKYPAWNVKPENLLIGSGSMGTLITLLRLVLGPGSSISGLSPQFTDSILQALYTGATYHPLRLKAPKFAIDSDILRRLAQDAHSLIYIDNPNNPTGQAIPLDRIEQIALEALKKGTWVIVDEAYGDFLSDEESAASIDLPNLVTCRSFSKGRGAAGIRVGFAVTRSPEMALAFRKLQPLFIIGTLDSLLAGMILQDDAFLEKTRQYVRTAKEKMTDALKGKNGLTVAATDLRVPIALLTRESGNLAALLGALGISCEPGQGFFDLDSRSVRLRVPSPAHLDEFLRRIETL